MRNCSGLSRMGYYGSLDNYCSWLVNLRFEHLVGMPDPHCQMQKRGTKASRRKQEVIMLKVRNLLIVWCRIFVCVDSIHKLV